MPNFKSYTFFPGSAVLYSGAVEDINEINMDGEYMATFERKQSSVIPGSEAKGLDAKMQSYVASSIKPRSVYSLSHVRDDLYGAQIAKKKILHYQAMAKGRGQFDAGVQRKLQEAYNEYKEFTAEINSDNTNQLTIVQFVNQIIGHLEQPSYVTAAFKNIPLDKLRGKIPEMGFPPVNIQVRRLSEPEISSVEFGQTAFRIFRNDVHIYTSREDRLEATIDPHAVSVSQGNIQAERARELLALKECSNLVVNGTYGTLPDPTSAGTAGLRSGSDMPDAFVNVITQHFLSFKNYLKYFIFHPNDYRAYLANWFTHAYTQVQVPEGFGVVPFFGLEKYGAVAIISPYMPRSTVYALCAEGAYELDGPKIIDAEYDAKKFADYNVLHDFIGYKIVNPTRFGEKLSMPISGVTPGTEITTNRQVYTALQPPTNLVVKNASA